MSASVRLLVIDDEVTLTRDLKLNLEDTGRYEVHAINDPNEAVAARCRSARTSSCWT